MGVRHPKGFPVGFPRPRMIFDPVVVVIVAAVALIVLALIVVGWGGG